MRSGQWIALLVGLTAMTMVVAGGALAAADGAGQASDHANESNVTVETGQQLSTVMAVTEDDVRTDVDDSTLIAENESERVAAIAERGAELRDRAESIVAEYRNVTDAYENGTISESEYAQRIAVLQAQADNLVESAQELETELENVSELDARSHGHNETALNEALEDVEAVRGAGPRALLAHFSGVATGELEIATRNGVRIEAESEDGERSREVRQPRDDETGFNVSQSDAFVTAQEQLSSQNGTWSLVEASVHDKERDGYYKFEFSLTGANETGNAEIRIDGSSGDAFRVEEEFEAPDDDENETEVEDEGEREDESEDETEDEQESEDDGEITLLVSDGTPAAGENVTYEALADGGPATNVTVYVNGEPVGQTDANGTVDVTLPGGDVKVSAEGEDADGEVEYEFAEGNVNIDSNADIADGQVSLDVNYAGEPVDNASVAVEDATVGTTDDSGSVSFEAPGDEEFDVTLNRGQLTVELTYEVRDGSLVLTETEEEIEEEEEDETETPEPEEEETDTPEPEEGDETDTPEPEEEDETDTPEDEEDDETDTPEPDETDTLEPEEV